MSAYDYAYQQVRKRLIAQAQVCAICGKPLDPNAPPRSRWSTSVDHVLPLKFSRSLPDELRDSYRLDPQHLRVTHLGCNSRRGARRLVKQHVSRQWKPATKESS
jgi:hypothetical protein